MFLSIAPPLMDFEDELLWINQLSNQNLTVLYDKSNYVTPNTKLLIEQAFIQPLSLQDQQILFDDLQKQSRNIAHQYGLTPAKVCISVLLKMVCTKL